MTNDVREARMLRERRIANGNEVRPTKFDLQQNVFAVIVDIDITPEPRFDDEVTVDLDIGPHMKINQATICGINAIDLRYFIAIRGVTSPGSEYMWVEEAQLFETRDAAEAEMEE